MISQSASAMALVPFVSVENMMRLILEIGVEQCLIDLTEYVEADFRRWEQFDRKPRIASHSSDGVIELMPTSDGSEYEFKYVNGHPKNSRSGKQTVTAFGVLASIETGYPVLMFEMNILTALRTAATLAMATRHLAPKGSRTLALIGNGAQSEFQASALKAVNGTQNVRLFGIDPQATARFAANLKAAGPTVATCGSTEEAVLGAEIITTGTADKRSAPILTDNMVDAGVHVNAIGGDCPGKPELHSDILLGSGIFVEYMPQTRIEGDIQQLATDHPVTELWQVISGQSPGRTNDHQITVFDGVGFALEDFSALRWLRNRLGNSQYSQLLDMIADPDDPRDLYRMILRENQRALAA